MTVALPLRFGVIGCGTIAYWAHIRHLEALRNARLVAVADPDLEARQRARRLTAAEAYADAYLLLRRSDIDAVVICAPADVQTQLAISAAQAGKHIYLEKPIATDLERARELRDVLATTSVKFAMGFNRREHPLHRQARRLIADAAIGKVRSVMSSFCEPAAALPTWKQRRATGGGVLLDLASHHIDMLRWTLSTEVSAVEARISSRVSEDDEAWLGLSLTSGVEVMSFFSFRSACTDWIEFIGENGTLRVDRHRAALSIRTARRSGYGTRLTWQPPSAEVLRWWMDRMRHPSRDPSYRFALLSHIRQLQGATTELADVEDGLRNLETVLAAEACGRSRGRVSMRRNV